MKTISIFLALVNGLLAGLLIASSTSFTGLSRAQIGWLAMKDAAATAVILVGVVTWLGIARPIARPLRPGLIPLCSLFLVALGAATAVWTLQQALITGDLEFHMAVYGGSLTVQGMASLFGFVGDSRSVSV